MTACHLFAGSHDEGMRQWRQQWSPALLAGLLNSREELRQAVATQAIPVVLQLDNASLLHLMRAALDAPQQQVTVLATMLLDLLPWSCLSKGPTNSCQPRLQASMLRFNPGCMPPSAK